MWAWKIYAANLTFSSVAEFPIYCEPEISAQDFPLPPMRHNNRLKKPIAVLRIYKNQGDFHTCSKVAHLLFSHTDPFVVTQKEVREEITRFYIHFSLSPCFTLEKKPVLLQRYRVEYTVYGPQDLQSISQVHMQMENLSPRVLFQGIAWLSSCQKL